MYVILSANGRITQFALPDGIHIFLGKKAPSIAFAGFVSARKPAVLYLLGTSCKPTIFRTVALVVIPSIHLESGRISSRQCPLAEIGEVVPICTNLYSTSAISPILTVSGIVTTLSQLTPHSVEPRPLLSAIALPRPYPFVGVLVVFVEN